MSDTAGRVTGRVTWDAAHPVVACGDSEVLAGTGIAAFPPTPGLPPVGLGRASLPQGPD